MMNGYASLKEKYNGALVKSFLEGAKLRQNLSMMNALRNQSD